MTSELGEDVQCDLRKLGNLGNKQTPADFFSLPEAENVSGVLFSNAEQIELEPFQRALASLPLNAFDAALAEIPPEWNNGSVVGKIRGHLTLVAEHAEQFAEEIRRRLA